MSIIASSPIRSNLTGIQLVRPSCDNRGRRLSLVILSCRSSKGSCVLNNTATTFSTGASSWTFLVVVILTKKAFYARTLATIWTTAPSLRHSCFLRLAALCLLATLTAAARCYAFKNLHHHLYHHHHHHHQQQHLHHQTNNHHHQRHHHDHHPNHHRQHTLTKLPPFFSIFDRSDDFNNNDNVPLQQFSPTLVLNQQQQPSSSSFLLSSQSDSSVILTSSKKRKRFRTKRELTSSPTAFNRIVDFETRKRRPEVGLSVNTILVDPEKRADVSWSTRINSDETFGSVIGDSSDNTVNSSFVKNAVPSEAEHQNDSTFRGEDAFYRHYEGSERPMPPVHDHGNASSVSDLGVLVLVLSAIVLTVALGLITCVLSHYRPVAGEGAGDGGTAADPHDAARPPTTAPMLSVVSASAAAGVGGMDRLRGGRAARELAATRDRQVRLHAVHTDIAINLPPNISMPDGEEHPFTSSRLHIRDPEQESEIYQKCVRPPPNRTVLESESPPPYRSSSAGLLGSSSTTSSFGGSYGGCGGGDWSFGGGGGAPLVVRCHSMSSSTTSSSSSSTSCSKRPEAGGSGQKTDFLHRTVKIFTGGGKRGTTTGMGTGGRTTPPPPPPPVPAVVVPTRRRTAAPSDHQTKNTTINNNKPSV